jgi:parallel beta-helix repeat protein
MSKNIVFSLVFVFVLMGVLGLAFRVQWVEASGTIYIRATGLVEGTDKIVSSDNVTYTFTDNIYDSIVVERNNTVLDGAGYKVQGTGSGVGIQLYYVSNVTVKNTQVKAFWVGIHLASSSNNSISGNNVTNNGGNGIEVSYSSNNTICGNNITESDFNGISLGSSSLNNKFYHNNFMNNTKQVYGYVSANVWDNGYPSGGNYWDDYDGTDANQDGIGDTSYTLEVGTTEDEYPLMGPISFFDTGTWNEITYYVHTVSNSTVSDFYFSETEKLIGFNVTGLGGTVGFCRVSIPNELLWCDNPEQWQIWADSTLIEDRNVMEDTSYVYIYFTYNQSTKTVEIQGTNAIPELPSLLILPLFMIATLLAVAACRKKRIDIT